MEKLMKKYLTEAYGDSREYSPEDDPYLDAKYKIVRVKSCSSCLYLDLSDRDNWLCFNRENIAIARKYGYDEFSISFNGLCPRYHERGD